MTDGVAHVNLQIPAAAQFLRVARLTVASAAGPCGFDVEEIEDLRIAVAEAVSVLIDAGGDVIDLAVQLRPGEVRVDGSTSSNQEPRVDDLITQILSAIVADFRCWSEGGRVRFGFRMVAAASGDDGRRGSARTQPAPANEH